MTSRIHIISADHPMDTSSEVYDVYTKSRLYKAMKPLFLSLKIFGLHHSRFFGSVDECSENVRCHDMGETYHGGNKATKKCSASQVYAWIVFVMMFLFVLRMVSIFTHGDSTFGPDLFFKLVNFCWVCLLLSNHIMFMLASHRYTGIPTFFIEWENLEISGATLQKVKRVTQIAMGISWLLELCTCMLTVYALISSPDLLIHLLAPFQSEETDIDGAILMRVIVAIFAPLLCALWVFPVAMDVVFCYTLYQSFTTWNAKFKAKMLEMTTETFIKERRQHQKICRLVSAADNFLSIHKAGSLVFRCGRHSVHSL